MSTVEKGFIFVLTNPSQPDLVLIGAGADHPERALRAGLLVDSTTGQTPILRYTALVEDIPASTQFIDDNLNASQFGIGYFQASVEDAIATIKQGSGSILYEEEISADQIQSIADSQSVPENTAIPGGQATPESQSTFVDDDQVDPSRQMVAVDDEDEDLWQRQTVRVNPRPRSWGPVPRGQRRTPSRSYRSNIKDRQLRKQNALRKLAASVDGNSEVDPRRDSAAESDQPVTLHKKKLNTRSAKKNRKDTKKKRERVSSDNETTDRDTDLKKKEQATLGNEPSNLWQSREQPPEVPETFDEPDLDPVLTPPPLKPSGNQPTHPVATPMARDNARIDLPEDTDDILDDISMNWLWQRNNDVNVRRESGDSFDIDRAERDGSESRDRIDIDLPVSPSQTISNPPPHPSPHVSSVGRTGRAKRAAEIQRDTVSALHNETNDISESAHIDISSGSDSMAAVDFLAEVPHASEADKIEMRVDPRKPAKQVPLPDERLRNRQAPALGGESANDENLSDTKITVSAKGADAPIVKIPGAQNSGNTANDAPQTSFTPPVDPAPQPIPIEPEQTNAGKKQPAKRDSKPAPQAPPAPPRSQHVAPAAAEVAAAKPPVEMLAELEDEPPPLAGTPVPRPAGTTKDVAKTGTAEPDIAKVDAKTSPPQMDASEIASWVKDQEETHIRKTSGRRALRLALLGVPLGALAGAAYLMAEPGLIQSTKIAIVIGAIIAGVVVCYTLARIFARNPRN